MAGADRRGSLGIDRNATARLSMQEHDEEDYDLAAMGISDGFRPSGMAAGGVTAHNRLSSQGIPQNAAGRKTPPPRPSSTTKPKGLDSFALRNDGAAGAVGPQRNSITAANTSTPSRSSSVSTEMAFVRIESPYQGPSGPSHPYQMYPQESRLARTASIATASTVPVPDRPYTGPGGPAHPYGLYPQNIVAEGETLNGAAPVASVPVGFPGSNNNYERRLGPEGEEIADIIGPDGHTEQLPPYTKYPDEALARKARPNFQLPLMTGAGGVGLATRNPEFDSHETLDSPQSRHSTRSITSDSSHQINMAAVTVSEKPQLKKWQKVAKRKICDIIPVWAIILTVFIFILFGIILGTVLTILKPKHPPPRHHPSGGQTAQPVVYTTMTTTFDASPLTASPTGLPALPTGNFALPISVPSIANQNCVVNTSLNLVWSCAVPLTSYTITVSQIPGAQNHLANYEINLGLGNSTFNDFYAFGTQPPVFPNNQVLNLVTDPLNPSRGPAWFFEMPYNKVVILPENALSSPNTKRDIEERNSKARRHTANDFGNRRGVAMPGDKPWFCYWNGTLLEAFIYVNQSSSASHYQYPSSSASPSAAPTITPSPTSGNTGSSSIPTSEVQSSPSSGASQQTYWPPGYPKVVRLEDRRIPRGDQAIPPYCVQQIIDPNGVAHPYLNSTGQPNTIYLSETQPSAVSQKRDFYSSKIENLETVKKRDSDLVERQSGTSCECVWNWS